MNVKMRKVNNHNVEVSAETVICSRIAFTEKNTDTEKVGSKADNKNRHSQANKQVFDRYKEPDIRNIQRYDLWENSVPQAAAQDEGNEIDLSDIDEKEMGGQVITHKESSSFP